MHFGGTNDLQHFGDRYVHELHDDPKDVRFQERTVRAYHVEVVSRAQGADFIDERTFVDIGDVAPLYHNRKISSFLACLEHDPMRTKINHGQSM